MSAPRLSAFARAETLKRLRQEKFDLLVIGGGINGAGVARDAASRGMKVALVEANDFASGTSSRSSKLIHGGIRYLENFEFGLVFEALSERRKLFAMAPHLVHPLRFIIPLYEGGRVGMFKMGLGMWAYDVLSLFEAPELHERISRAEAAERLPALRQEQLLGAYAYSDAYMDDDRLVIETLRSAVSFGATCVNYTSAKQAQFQDGRVAAVVVEDQFTKEIFAVEARHVISTVGPWTDHVAPHLVHQWRKLLRPSKGVHLTFHRERLPLKEAVVMAAEKRIVFGIPRHEMVIVGTTDTDFPGDPRDVGTSRADVDYLLGVVDNYFPGAKITEADILASYSGVRPLVDDSAESESQVSREHVILSFPEGVTFVAGGKYTTYRLMAEQTVAAALNDFPAEDHVRFGQSRSAEPLNPLVTEESYALADVGAAQLSRDFHLSADAAAQLWSRHGGESRVILAEHLPQVAKSLGPNLGSGTDELLWGVEFAHAAYDTMCLSLRDFYLRRSPLFLSRKDHGRSLLPVLARVGQSLFGWSDQQIKEQVDALNAHLRQELTWPTKPSRPFG